MNQSKNLLQAFGLACLLQTTVFATNTDLSTSYNGKVAAQSIMTYAVLALTSQKVYIPEACSYKTRAPQKSSKINNRTNGSAVQKTVTKKIPTESAKKNLVKKQSEQQTSELLLIGSSRVNPIHHLLSGSKTVEKLVNTTENKTRKFKRKKIMLKNEIAQAVQDYYDAYETDYTSEYEDEF